MDGATGAGRRKMQGSLRGVAPTGRGWLAACLCAVAQGLLIGAFCLRPLPASAAPDRLDDSIPDATPSAENGISASYGFANLKLDGPLSHESTWHNFYKLRYSFSDDVALRVFYESHDLAGGYGLLSPVMDLQDSASAYGFDLSMNMLQVPAKCADKTANKPWEAGSSFNLGVAGKQWNIDGSGLSQQDQELSAYLDYSTDLTEKIRAHTYFSTGRLSGDAHTGSVNRVGAGLDYLVQKGRHPLILMANGLLDIYNFRQPSFNTSRVSRFDIGLRYKLRAGIYANAGLMTLNDSENDASGSGIFASLNYVDEKHDYGALGDPIPAQPPPPPPAPPPPAAPADGSTPPPPAQTGSLPPGDSVEVGQAPMMMASSGQPKAGSASRQASAVASDDPQRSSTGAPPQLSKDVQGSLDGRPPQLDEPAYVDSAMLDPGLSEKVSGGPYFYNPDLAQENADAAQALPTASAAAGADETAKAGSGPLVVQTVDPEGVAVPNFPISAPKPPVLTAELIRAPAGQAHSGRRMADKKQKQAAQTQERQHTAAARQTGVSSKDSGYGLTPQQDDELARLLASSAQPVDDSATLVLQREAVLGPEFGRSFLWPLLEEAHIRVLQGGWVSYSNFDAAK